MQARWALMNGEGDWLRDDRGKVLTFFSEPSARAQLETLMLADAAGGWTLEQFTVEDALEEEARSPFASEGGL